MRPLAVIVSVLLSSCFAAPVYEGPETDHFDGRRFVNVAPRRMASPGELLSWLLTREPGEWAEWTDAPPGPAPRDRVEGDALRVTWVDHACVLVQTAGLNVLTDPVWSDRVGPLSWTGPQRKRPPGLRFEDLPPIDVVVISHNHYDHLDLPTLRRLAREHSPRFVVPLGVGLLLEEEEIPGSVELDWWEALDVGADRSVVAIPAQHFSGRGLTDADRTLWAGFLVRAPGGDVYYAGDTAFGPHFLRVRERFGRPRLAVLPAGAYDPPEIMGGVHMSPEEAVHAHRILGAGVSVPVHWGTFAHTDEPQWEPPMRILAALHPGESQTFWILEQGQGYDVGPMAAILSR